MITKKGIKILIYTILLICTITLYSNTTSNAKYYKKGTLNYGVNYKKMTADDSSITRSIPSETLQNFVYKFSFDRSGNSKDGEYDQYVFELSNTNLDCSITSISDNSGNTFDNVYSIIYDDVGTERITANISCNVPSNLSSTEILNLKVNVTENIYYNDTDKLTYNYLTEPYLTTAGDYYEKNSAPEGVDPNNPKVFYMNKSATDKNQKLLDWLKYYTENSDSLALYSDISNYINSYNLNDSTINESMSVSGITVESLGVNYKFTITDNFSNYVLTYNGSLNDPMSFYFNNVTDTATANSLFFEYLEKYYKPSVTDDQYNTVVQYINSNLNGGSIIDFISKGNRLGITYSASTNLMKVPKDMYTYLTTTNIDFDLNLSQNAAITTIHRALYMNLTTKCKFIPKDLITQITGTSSNPSYTVKSIKTDGTLYDSYSYYTAGSVNALIHVYYDSVNAKHKVEIDLIENNEFTLTYDSSIPDIDTLIGNDIDSIRQNVGSGYTVIPSAIIVNGEGKKEVTITITAGAQTSSVESNINVVDEVTQTPSVDNSPSVVAPSDDGQVTTPIDEQEAIIPSTPSEEIIDDNSNEEIQTTE